MIDQAMAVSDALRATRLGNLKYDKHWLDSGKTRNEVLALCSKFEKTLSISAEDERVITTSPKGRPVCAEDGSALGLGGGREYGEGSETAAKSGGSSVSSRTVETPSSEVAVGSVRPLVGSECFQKRKPSTLLAVPPSQDLAFDESKALVNDFTIEGKREEPISEFELAALWNENEWERRRKETIDSRLKLLRNQWEEYQKKLLLPSLPRLASPAVTVVDPAIGSGFEDVPATSQASDSVVYAASTATEYQQLTVPLAEELLDGGQCIVATEDEEQRPSSPLLPTITTPGNVPQETVTVETSFRNDENAISQASGSICAPGETIEEQQRMNVSEEPPKANTSLTAAQPIQSPPVEKSSVEIIERTEAEPSPPPKRQNHAQADVASDGQAVGGAVDPTLSHIRISRFDVDRFASVTRLDEYKRSVASYLRQKEEYEYFQKRMAAGFCSKTADRVTKGVRHELTIFVTTKINLLSLENLPENIRLLGQLVNGDTVLFQGNRLSIRKHPDAGEFVCELIARTLVKQAENVVSVRRDIVYPLAAIAIGLWVAFPRVGEFLKAIVSSNCVYTIPHYPARDSSDSDQDYLVKLGYQRDSSGEIEKQDQFLKRMRGICRFWTAMVCTPAVPWNKFLERRILRSTVCHPLDFHVGWTFLASLVQLKPRSDITATILLEFLEMASHFLKRVYGRQFEKLLRFISVRYLPEISAISSARAGSANYVRLKAFLESGPKRFALPDDYPRAWSR